MQTGVFFVRLKPSIPEDEQGEALSGRIVHLREIFDIDTPYPVLAVEYRGNNRLKKTFYHMPTKQNQLEWFSSEYFEFARQT